MSSSTSELITIIQTKLNRPKIPIDLVPRMQLIAWLDEYTHYPITWARLQRVTFDLWWESDVLS
ncbi:hypothetical protein ACFLUA_01970 [Chloroflexota bacterium]